MRARNQACKHARNHSSPSISASTRGQPQRTRGWTNEQQKQCGASGLQVHVRACARSITIGLAVISGPCCRGQARKIGEVGKGEWHHGSVSPQCLCVWHRRKKQTCTRARRQPSTQACLQALFAKHFCKLLWAISQDACRWTHKQ